MFSCIRKKTITRELNIICVKGSSLSPVTGVVNWECIWDSNSPTSSCRRDCEAEGIQTKIRAAAKTTSWSAKRGGSVPFVLGHVLAASAASVRQQPGGECVQTAELAGN